MNCFKTIRLKPNQRNLSALPWLGRGMLAFSLAALLAFVAVSGQVSEPDTVGEDEGGAVHSQPVGVDDDAQTGPSGVELYVEQPARRFDSSLYGRQSIHQSSTLQISPQLANATCTAKSTIGVDCVSRLAPGLHRVKLEVKPNVRGNHE